MIGIIGAMEVEIKRLKKIMDTNKEYVKLGRKFYKGTINGVSVVLAISGVGKVNAAVTTSIMCESFKTQYIINIGVAGGIEPLKPLDIIIVDKLCYHDVDLTAIGYEKGKLPDTSKIFYANEEIMQIAEVVANEHNLDYHIGSVASGDLFATDIDCLKGLNEDIIAIEMEGAAIAHVCKMYHIPFVSLRVISDIIGSHDQAIAFNLVEEKAADLASLFVIGLLKEVKIV